MRYPIVLTAISSLWLVATASAQVAPEQDLGVEASAAAHAGYPVPTRAIDAVVLGKLRADERLAEHDIDVKTDRRNVVTLTGEVSSEDEKAHAAGIAENTDAVSDVRNRIVVRP